MLVDVNPELDFLEFGPGRTFVAVLLRKIVTKLAEIYDLADGRTGRGRDLDQVEPHTLRPAQGVGQFHDAELLPRLTQNDPDFASANPAVHPNLCLQISSVSKPAKRECAVLPCFHPSHFPSLAFVNDRALGIAAAAIDHDEGLAC